ADLRRGPDRGRAPAGRRDRDRRAAGRFVRCGRTAVRHRRDRDRFSDHRRRGAHAVRQGAGMTEPAPATPDPLRSFRRVIAAVLVLEGVVVLLALPLVAKLGEGLATWQGILVGALALALFVACGFAGRPWAIGLALGLQVVMIACWFAVTALGILGVIFALV